MPRYNKRKAEGLFYLKFAIIVGVGIIVIFASQISIVRSSTYVASQVRSKNSEEKCSDKDIGCNLFAIKSSQRSKSQVSRKKVSANDIEYIVLMLATSHDEYNLTRAVNRVLNMTRGITINVAVSISQEAPINLIDLLNGFPIHLIEVPKVKKKENVMEFNDNLGPTIKEKILKGYQIFKNLFSTNQGSCPSQAKSTVINILNTDLDRKEIIKYKFPEKDLQTQRNVTFGRSKYNPNMQRYFQVQIENGLGSSQTHFDKFKKECQSLHYIKTSLKLLLESFPGLKNIILVDDQSNFSPNIIQYFQHANEIFSLDVSIYCVSAYAPLSPEKSKAPSSNLTRLDHFVFGGATLIPVKIAKEIIEVYQEPLAKNGYREFPSSDNGHPMDNLSNWFSFLRHRKGRGCVVPYRSRVCPLSQQCNEPPISYDMRKLIRYKFSIELLPKLESAEDLKYSDLPCNSNEPLKPKNGSKSLSVYVKMDSHDDDITMFQVMKCFGLRHETMIGNFDGVYSFYWEDVPIYLLGVPYSRFGPTIVKGAELLMVLLEPLSVMSITTINKYNDYLHRTDLNVSAVPYAMGDDVKT